MLKTKWLNYHHLYYFHTIAHEGGVAKAALKLRLGQPTLSTQLRQFEDSLGEKLFERKHKSLVLTETGRMVLSYANDIFRLGGELLDSVSDQHHAIKSHIQIGATDTVPKYVTARLVESSRAFKDCVVTVREGATEALLRELESHELDLVICNTSPSLLTTKKLYARKVKSLPVLVCGAKKFVGLKKGFPESLAHQPIVFPTTQCKFHHDLRHFFLLRDIPLNIVAEIQDSSLSKILGIHGVGLLPISEFATRELVQAKLLFPIGLIESVQEEIWLVGTQRKIQNPIAEHILKTFTLS